MDLISQKNGIDLSFEVRENKNDDDLQIINGHRIKKNLDSDASKFLEELVEIFSQVARKRNKKRLVVIFEIEGRPGSDPESVRTWLSRLGYLKIEELSSEKWIKIYNL